MRRRATPSRRCELTDGVDYAFTAITPPRASPTRCDVCVRRHRDARRRPTAGTDLDVDLERDLFHPKVAIA
jgi:hypothetical protein